jgi:glycosyltransferase involved in cell wall biosynthesis
MKILFLTSRFPQPPVGGDRLRAFNIIQHLSQAFDVDVFSLYSGPSEIAQDADLKRVCGRLHIHLVPRWRRLYNTVKGWLRGLPMQTAYYTDASARRRVDELLAHGGYDVVVVHLVRMLEYVNEFPAERVVLELTDAISMNYNRIRRPKNPREFLYVAERARLRRYELQALRRVARGILVAETDAAYLVNHGASRSELLVVRNGTVFAGLPRSMAYDSNRIVFLGNMRTTQNEDMCLWFINAILPRIQAVRPATIFVVAGANPSRKLLSYHGRNGIQVLGLVEDPAAVLSASAVSVCPMRYGAGLQNKILESMAVGVPVVATSCGAEGLGIHDEGALLVADDPQAFAEAVLRVLADPALRSTLGERASAMVSEHFRWSDQMDVYVRIVRAAADPAAAVFEQPVLEARQAAFA